MEDGEGAGLSEPQQNGGMGGKYSSRRVFRSQICTLWTKHNYRYTLASVISREEPRSQHARACTSFNREGGGRGRAAVVPRSEDAF